MISASEAIQRLRDGNERFVTGARENANSYLDKRTDLVSGQSPFAVILGCSDSRVPSEIVFDQGLGDLFVIRVAGNIVAPSQIGSVEFAASMFGTPLVVILGHSHCGAVTQTIDDLRNPSPKRSDSLLTIVNRIRPTVESLVEAGLDKDKLLTTAIRANIRASVNQLRHGSQMLEQLANNGKLTIVGAEYSLETGVVDFFEGV